MLSVESWKRLVSDSTMTRCNTLRNNWIFEFYTKTTFLFVKPTVLFSNWLCAIPSNWSCAQNFGRIARVVFHHKIDISAFLFWNSFVWWSIPDFFNYHVTIAEGHSHFIVVSDIRLGFTYDVLDVLDNFPSNNFLFVGFAYQWVFIGK